MLRAEQTRSSNVSIPARPGAATSCQECQPHPLDAGWEAVMDHDGSAVLVAGEALPVARVRHRAPRLVARVVPVVGVTDRAGGFHFEQRVDAFRAERVRAL